MSSSISDRARIENLFGNSAALPMSKGSPNFFGDYSSSDEDKSAEASRRGSVGSQFGDFPESNDKRSVSSSKSGSKSVSSNSPSIAQQSRSESDVEESASCEEPRASKRPESSASRSQRPESSSKRSESSSRRPSSRSSSSSSSEAPSGSSCVPPRNSHKHKKYLYVINTLIVLAVILFIALMIAYYIKRRDGNKNAGVYLGASVMVAAFLIFLLYWRAF